MYSFIPVGCKPGTGTEHVPGIQPEDAEILVQNGAQVAILSKGVQEMLQVQQRTIDYLEQQGITVHVLQSEAAVERYNALCADTPVGLLLHSTC